MGLVGLGWAGLGWAGVEGGGTGAASRRDMFLGCAESLREIPTGSFHSRRGVSRVMT